MVDLVDILVQWSPMKSTMQPVVSCVLHDEEEGDLASHFEDRGKRHASLHAEVVSRWMEEPDSD